MKIPLVGLHCLTIVSLCQVNFSALDISIVEELHFSISLFKITMSMQLQNADLHKMIYISRFA